MQEGEGVGVSNYSLRCIQVFPDCNGCIVGNNESFIVRLRVYNNDSIA